MLTDQEIELIIIIVATLIILGVVAYVCVKGEISKELPSKYVTDSHDFPTHTGSDDVVNVL